MHSVTEATKVTDAKRRLLIKKKELFRTLQEVE